MPSTDMGEVANPLPGVMSRLPVLLDESGAERVVGWYKYADGTKKPVYEKGYVLNNEIEVLSKTWVNINIDATNIEKIIGHNEINPSGANFSGAASITIIDNKINIQCNRNVVITESQTENTFFLKYGSFQYTKTTDTAS